MAATHILIWWQSAPGRAKLRKKTNPVMLSFKNAPLITEIDNFYNFFHCLTCLAWHSNLKPLIGPFMIIKKRWKAVSSSLKSVIYCIGPQKTCFAGDQQNLNNGTGVPLWLSRFAGIAKATRFTDGCLRERKPIWPSRNWNNTWLTGTGARGAESAWNSAPNRYWNWMTRTRWSQPDRKTALPVNCVRSAVRIWPLKSKRNRSLSWASK